LSFSMECFLYGAFDPSQDKALAKMVMKEFTFQPLL
jgi:hypothetical protein